MQILPKVYTGLISEVIHLSIMKIFNSSTPATAQTLHSHSVDGATLLGCLPLSQMNK